MKLNLNCFFPAAATEVARGTQIQEPPPTPPCTPPLSPSRKQVASSPPTPPTKHIPSAPTEPCSTLPMADACVGRSPPPAAVMKLRLPLGPASTTGGIHLRDKMRHLGDILRSLESSRCSGDYPSSRGYRRDWLESEMLPAAREMPAPAAPSPRPSVSVRSTPRDRDNSLPVSGIPVALGLQLNRLESMLKGSRQAAPPLVQADPYGEVLARLAKVEELCKEQKPHNDITRDRVSSKAVAALESLAWRVEDQLKRTDVAMRKVEKKVYRLSVKRKKLSLKCCSRCTKGDSEMTEAAEKRSLLEEVRKKCEDNNVEVKLCWSAMNQLCVDNETFRTELQRHRSWLQRLAAGSTIIQTDEAPDEGRKPACGRWSSSGMVQ